MIRVTEVVHLEREQRLRARLLRPKGWITLRNTETGRRVTQRGVMKTHRKMVMFHGVENGGLKMGLYGILWDEFSGNLIIC